MTENPITEAVAFYNDLLSHPGEAAESWGELEAAMREERLMFGDRPVCTVLRPYFLSPVERGFVAGAARDVLDALRRVYALLDARDFEPLLGLSPAEAELARLDARFEPPETIARLDGFLTRGGQLGFVEYNAESPGGIAFGATLARIFATLPVMRRFTERYTIRSEPVLDHTLDALLGAYRQWGGTRGHPRIAIVDRRDARTAREFSLCSDAFRARGFETAIADPDELEYAGGRLRAGAFEIDLVYRRIVASDVAANLGPRHALVRAARDGAVCISSGFRAFAMHSKALFALASEAAARGDLPASERAAVDAHVPWTRLVREAKTTDWEGRVTDLIAFAASHRDELVVKPATDYGGAGVTLGWQVEPAAWERALAAALTRPFVLQRRIPVPSEPFPCIVDGRVQLLDLHADVDPYCFNGNTDLGTGTRLSPSQLLNVSAGLGSAAPVFVVEPHG
jgi:hypothetical protein